MLRSVFTKGTQIPTFPSGAKKRRKVIQKKQKTNNINRYITFLNCQKLALSLKILYRLGSEIYSEAFFGGGEFKKIFFMNHHSVLRMCMSSSENGCFLTSFFLLVLQLCMVSLSLFRTLLSLNCEDVMLQLVLRFVCASEHFAKCYTSKGLLHTSSHLD